MSMLADRKRKQKWSLNPNGKEWSQDSNKFGQKLLEKMGWQHGKGLGAKENGVTEHIKVTHKIDSRGMGYKETNDQWTEHESNFTALLAALSGDQGSKAETKEIQLNSLEKKSQNSRARVHYHKFTRGKDLSRYSEKDLANIFGKKSLKSEPKKENAEKADTEKESGLYFNGGSMKDYFKKKIPSFGKINDFIVGNNGVLKKAEDSESESDMKPSFGFGFKSEETNSPSVTSNQTSFISYIQEDNTPSKRKAEKENPQEVFSPTKKHKKDKKQKINDLGVSNPAFDPLASPNRILQKHVLDPIEESPSEYVDENNDTIVTQSGENSDSSEKLNENDNNISYVSIGKKKKKNTIDENNTIAIEDQIIQDITESQKKSQKKKKRKTDIACSELESKIKASDSDSKDEPNEYETNSYSKKRKGNKLLYDNPSFQIHNISMEESSTTPENPYEVKLSSKKQKKKNKLLDMKNSSDEDKNNGIGNINESTVVSMEIDNAGFDNSANITETCTSKENPYEVKIRGKKSSKKCAVKNSNFDSIEYSLNTNYISEENDQGVKPKKSKKSKGTSASDLQQEHNKEANNDSTILEDCDLILNVVSTPIIKTETPAAGSVTRVNDLRRRKSVRFSDVTQELIIPNNDDLREMYDSNNAAPGNLDAISKTLDNFQAEMENDINEEKVKTVTLEDLMVGEVGNPHGENEKLPEGTKLKFKYAHLNTKTPFHQMDKVGPRKSYKHLIKGDIVVQFKNTNLHEIEGYGVKNKTAV